MRPTLPLSPSCPPRTLPLALRLALCAGLALPSLAWAQAPAGTDRSVASVQAPDTPPLPTAATAATTDAVPPVPGPVPQPLRQTDIGSATERLLSLQSAPHQAQAPRPIPGEQARRSYARYLKSFETEIPPLYKTGSDSGGRN